MNFRTVTHRSRNATHEHSTGWNSIDALVSRDAQGRCNRSTAGDPWLRLVRTNTMHDDIHHEAWRDRVTPELLDAVRQGNVPEVRRRLDDGLPANWQDAEGCSLIFRRHIIANGPSSTAYWRVVHRSTCRIVGDGRPLLGRLQRSCRHCLLPDRPRRQSRRAQRGRVALFGAVKGHVSGPASPRRRCEAEPARCGGT